MRTIGYSTKFDVRFEFKTLEEAEEARIHIGKYYKNISKLLGVWVGLEKRTRRIIEAIGSKELTTKQIFSITRSSSLTYKTVQRDLKWMVLTGKLKMRKEYDGCYKNYFSHI